MIMPGKGPSIMAKYQEVDGIGEINFYMNDSYDLNIYDTSLGPLYIGNVTLGKELYDRMREDRTRDEFARRKIEIIVGGNLPEELEKELDGSLKELAMSNNPNLLREFKVGSNL